jgi:hypothetical protein
VRWWWNRRADRDRVEGQESRARAEQEGHGPDTASARAALDRATAARDEALAQLDELREASREVRAQREQNHFGQIIYEGMTRTRP